MYGAEVVVGVLEVYVANRDVTSITILLWKYHSHRNPSMEAVQLQLGAVYPIGRVVGPELISHSNRRGRCFSYKPATYRPPIAL
jgi:hypothetical protein